MACVRERVVDGRVLALLEQYLNQPVMEPLKTWTPDTGTPQGAVISPVLANLYLNPLDHMMAGTGEEMVRYADDFVVLCRQGVGEPLNVVRHVMDRLGLTLNETKTHVVNAKDTGFNFLGFTLQMSHGAKTGKWYPNVRPSDQAVSKIMARLTALTRRELTCIPLDDVVGSVNRSLRGWASYFHFRNSSLAMSKVRNHAEQRLRIHLRKRHKVRDRMAGYAMFTHRALYERYGLYKVPTTAVWKNVQALS